MAEPKGKPGPKGPAHLKGRIRDAMAGPLADASVSVSFDRKLAPHDIAASKAHAALLHQAGLLSLGELKQIVWGLDEIGGRIERGEFAFDPALEDVHMNIERALIELAGPVGAKLQTGRSRNEQVAVAERRYMRHEAADINLMIIDLMLALIRRALDFPGHVIPAYSHMRRVQPVMLASVLMAHAEALARDRERLRNCASLFPRDPYGSGALSGTGLPFPESPGPLRGLGLGSGYYNSMDVVASRDIPLTLMSALSVLAVNLSRLGEELVLWAGSEFGFLSFPDSLSTTSSLMPQKKNPDGAELLRGKSSRLIGNFLTLLVVVKGLPLTYNRDLQEDKEPLFDSVETVKLMLPLATALVEGAVFDFTRMRDAAQDVCGELEALSGYLAGAGVPADQAHAYAAGLASFALRKGRALGELSPEELLALYPPAAGFRPPGAPATGPAPGPKAAARAAKRGAPGAPGLPRSPLEPTPRWLSPEVVQLQLMRMEESALKARAQDLELRGAPEPDVLAIFEPMGGGPPEGRA
jgi:argininosuccinate lyase